MLFNDKVSSYQCLLEKCKASTLHLRCIKTIAQEVYKSLNDLNPPFMKEMFDQKQLTYNLRDNNLLIQPKFKRSHMAGIVFNTMEATFEIYYQ